MRLHNIAVSIGQETEEGGPSFFASDEASFITGATLVADGGYVAR